MRMGLARHVARMVEEEYTMLLARKPEGKRPPGTRRFVDIKIDLKGRGESYLLV
jgi:hypothetical protein